MIQRRLKYTASFSFYVFLLYDCLLSILFLIRIVCMIDIIYGMAEGDAYTGMMCMSLWSNNRSCDGVSEYMSVWVYMCCTVSYITVCAGMVYIVCIAWHSMVYVLYIIVYISMSVIWWCVTEWSKAHLTHWQGNRAMTEPWASVYMILCQCARS